MEGRRAREWSLTTFFYLSCSQLCGLTERGSGTIYRNDPQGAVRKWFLTPFQPPSGFLRPLSGLTALQISLVLVRLLLQAIEQQPWGQPKDCRHEKANEILV